MNNELLQLLDVMESERGIDREVLISLIEESVKAAAAKSMNPATEIEVKLDRKSGKLKVWAILEVVNENPGPDQILYNKVRREFPETKPGDKIKWEIQPRDFGRIAAKAAQQALAQQLRSVEKQNVVEEFSDRVHSLLNGIVSRFEGGNVIIDFQRAEGVMSSRDKIPGEIYMPGDRINAMLVKVDPEAHGPSLIVSRSNNDFIRLLFEREVSEIRDGIVEIKAIARDPGVRTKIAVASNDSRIDPVGACVGQRGMRVRGITAELGNERVDIVPWSEDVRQFAINAMSPAQITSLEVNEENRTMIAKVTEEQSKLAFGKRGQNVQLSGKLVGYRILIQNIESGLEEKIRMAVSNLMLDTGINEETANIMVRSGYVTIDGLKAAGEAAVAAIEGIDADEVARAFRKING